MLTYERVTGVSSQSTEDAIKNELECPLLLQSKMFVMIESEAIQNTVSLVHPGPADFKRKLSTEPLNEKTYKCQVCSCTLMTGAIICFI